MTVVHPIIDAWMQHPTPRMAAHPMFAPLVRWTGRALSEPLPVAATLAAMDRATVGRALVCAWWGPQGPLADNDEVAAVVAAAPERFVGVASVDLDRPMAAIRELRRCVRTLGFRALRILPWLWRAPPDDRRYYPLYAECIELGIPFCLQVGHTGPLGPSETGRPIPYLDTVALDFPELVIVGGHIGWPWTLEMIALCRKYPNVYLDTSAYKPSRYPPELVEYMRTSGCKKVLFGSNYPMLMPHDCVAELDALGLDADARRRFVHDNAVAVFGLSVA
ncbi:MAG: amidohydrolase family protein [Nannocystaceae bacterium]|nr:amidohydrolase family protein [Nannocystaceae bacterium]